MTDDLVKRLRDVAEATWPNEARQIVLDAADRIEALEAELAEARRRRDAWKAKAEDYDTIRAALRKKVGAPWPPSLSRSLWAALAADEKQRADDAEAENARLQEALMVDRDAVAVLANYQQADEEGIMLLVSRQTIEECLPALRAAAEQEAQQ